MRKCCENVFRELAAEFVDAGYQSLKMIAIFDPGVFCNLL
jgi:hypothetical protein